MGESKIQVAIIMGSLSDLPIMKEASEILSQLGVSQKTKIVSAHRTPEDMFNFAKSAHKEGYQAIIAGAGGAAHLPGMVASLTSLPVIGVPIKSKQSLDGWDSILSILQMPAGVPVATVALNSGKNAGILAAQIVATSHPQVYESLLKYKEELKTAVAKQNEASF